MPRREMTKAGNYSGYKINNKSPLVVQVLDKIISQIEAMHSCYSKVTVLRIDLFVGEDECIEDGGVIKFINLLRDRLKSKYKTPKVGYVWARENSDEFYYEDSSHRGDHIHLALILDGHKVQSMGRIGTDTCEKDGVFGLVNQTWRELYANGRVWGLSSQTKQPNIFVIKDRSSEESQRIKRDCIYALSYLAKDKTKITYARCFGGSAIKPR